MRQPENEGLMRYLEKSHPKAGVSDLSVPTETELYEHRLLGTHPELIERVWDRLVARIPPESRRIILGRAALVSTRSNVIFAIAIGTSYAIRIPKRVKTWRFGLKTTIGWSDGTRRNVKATFGPEWVVGSWSSKEEEWCPAAYEYFSRSK